MRLRWIGIGGVISVVVPLACASEGDVGPQGPADAGSGADSGVVADGSGDRADAEVDAEAGIDSCAVLGLCVASAPIDSSINLTSVWGSSASDVWAVGTNRTVVHYDGSKWEKHVIENDPTSSATMRAVWVGRSDDVWIVDGLVLRHSTGWKGDATEWSSYHFYPPGTATGNAPFGLSGRDGSVWIARLGWVQYDPPGTLIKCSGWGEGGALVDAEHLGYSGNDQTYFTSGYGAVAMTRADEAWATSLAVAVWSGSRVMRVVRSDTEPTVWRHEEFDSRTVRELHGIWGNEDVVWLVGEGGVTRRMTRSAIPSRAFEVIETPVNDTLRGVFGFGPDDVWAVGDESTILHWDGQSWTKLATPFDGAGLKPRLFGVWGSSKDDVWIVGGGVVIHFERRGA
ncbi:hypothetical protein AKJ09_05133 [Labilithrix luteola]|uniref:Type IV fimbrial biogenesis protein PilY1 n=1 Tax=Labilithrix luteola TaxID=1391654 RepID=A0A0K1PZ89_9BACT|nr:hypothetical protein [Labilithrix luteola]AKU98469.1 hypothetical protein AKJ09_05133 [Labilithrix luteola]